MRRFSPILVSGASALLLVGCSSAAPVVAPQSTSASATPTPTPTPTPSPTPTPTPVVTWPLTGLPASGDINVRPALMVKVDNVGGAVPQAGLNSADMVVEEPVEGGLTRFIAIFQSRDPVMVGPIRSARPFDAEVSRMLGGGGILLFSGASPHEIAPVKALSHATLIADDWNTAPGVFHRDSNRPGEHDLFGSSTDAWAWARANHKPSTAPARPFAIGQSGGASAGQVRATEVAVPFESNNVQWNWSGTQWLRSQHGEPHETTDGGQVRADTVVIISVSTHIDPALHDVLGNPTPVVDFTGSHGKAWVLRDGTAVEGTWSRPSIDAPLALTDSAGRPIGVKAGRTWLEVLPNSSSPTVR